MSRSGPARAAVEREAKLVAPARFGLPDLTGLVPGATAVALPEARLDATYYDTADLRLARFLGSLCATAMASPALPGP